jgi:hypothetical protein
MITAVRQHFRSRAAALLASLESRLDRVLLAWLLVAGLAAATRIAAASAHYGSLGLAALAPYALLVLCPVASTLLALRWFADGDRQPQPAFRLALVGTWRKLEPAEARSHPLYGTGGLMVSLLLAMMLNVPARALEYIAVMPPVPDGAPQWVAALRTAMTLDVVLFTSLYMVAFVAALRRVPLFPRLLVAIWACDLAMQLGIAQILANEQLPAAGKTALEALLTGNAQKVLIAIALWLPYLLLSTRVNVTYRHRIPAE